VNALTIVVYETVVGATGLAEVADVVATVLLDPVGPLLELDEVLEVAVWELDEVVDGVQLGRVKVPL